MKVLTYTVFAVLFMACSPSTNEDLAETEIVGADRTEQGCIPSAGYQWSAAKGECVRLWEVGLELIHQGSGDRNYSAYVVKGDNAAELFLPDLENGIILNRFEEPGGYLSWRSADGTYILTDLPSSALAVTDENGFVMYAQDDTNLIPTEFVEHSADESGGEPQMAEGVVSSVEDGAYPMFTLHLIEDGMSVPTSFSLMAEGADLGGADLYTLEGKTVSIEYVEPERWDLISIALVENENDMDVEPRDGWHFVSGRLHGASNITGGDLPDELTINVINGERIVFDYYIDEQMVALNNRDVSAWLAPTANKDILSLRVKP